MKVLRPEDADLILKYENELLARKVADEMEREFASWHAKWRREALEHYLPLGWSFGLFAPSEPELRGYFLAQPFLFFRGMTQTLWVEHVRAADAAAARQLVELAYRCSRDKHLQTAVFHGADDILFALEPWRPSRLDDTLIEIKTAKF